MFDLSPEKLIVVAIIAMVFMGPERLPRAARTLGRVMAQVRAQSGSFQAELQDALAEPRQAITDAVGDLGLPTGAMGLPTLPNARNLITQALTAPPVAAASREASVTGPGSEQRAVPSSALPDDPSLN